MSYPIAAPDLYFAIPGTGINVTKTTKCGWVWPFQRCIRFSIQPCDYLVNLQDMTREKLKFSLPVVFTVSPDVNQRSGADARHNDIPDHDREDRSDSLMKYAMLLADADTKKKTSSQFLENTVKAIIEGETRVLVSGMTMKEIFTEPEVFKKRLYCNTQSELSQFGLRIFEATVEELHDVPGRERVLAEVNLPRPSSWRIRQKEMDTLQSCLGPEGPSLSADTWRGLRSVADDKPAFTPTQRDLDAWYYASIKNAEAKLDKELKKAEGILSLVEAYGKLGNAVNATLMHAPKEGLRTERCTGLKSERRAREEQLEYVRKYLDVVYFPNSNLTDVDGHIPSRGGSVEDVLTAILEGDGLHHHGDGRRPPARPAHGHGQGSSRLVPVAERPLAGRSKGNSHRFPPLLAKLMSGLCIMWGLGVPVALAHRIPDWLLHIVGGTTVAAGACVPALQPAEGETKAYRTGAYIAWAVTFAIFITMELYRRQDQRRLLLGLVVFCGANLLGSLAEDSSTTIDTIKNWGPLALSLSLWVVPEWIQLMGARQVADAVAGA